MRPCTGGSMQVNVYLRDYITKQGEKRYYLVIRQKGRQDRHVTLGAIGKRKAEERRGLILKELLNGTYEDYRSVRLYFSEFCEKFLREFAQGSRALATVRQYEYCLAQAKDRFKGLRLDQIQREDIEVFLSELQIQNRTKNIFLNALRMVFRKAREWRYLKTSPADGIRPFKEAKVGSRSLTLKELGLLLDAAKPRTRSLIKVMVYTGMRPGEVTQFKFEDIDWETRQIRVVSDKVRQTKNRKTRVIPMSDDLWEELKFLWDYYPVLHYEGSSKQSFLPRTEAQRVYVFCDPGGRPHRCIRLSLKRLFKKVGIEGVTPHGLRKTFCTLLARNRVHPKVAQELLGHSRMQLTMDIYTEVSDDQKTAAVASLPTCRELAMQKFQVVGGNKT
ncbi:MAG TPA: hypothetical protein DF383_10430 [Deltaproteobacteria bacterium]|nr:hypothetical protein [Deltaproteobacteria bacterium]